MLAPMDLLTTASGLAALARALHVGLAAFWVGTLFLLTVLQAPLLATADTAVRRAVLEGQGRPALRWLRGAALATFVTGIALFAVPGVGPSLDGALGAVLGSLMALNVWLLVSPGQEAVLAGREDAGPGAARAHRAARTNLVLLGPTLLLMVTSAHHPVGGRLVDASPLALAGIAALVLALEGNAICGGLGPLASVPGALVSSVALAAACWGLLAFV
jgi:hypothetical protein